MTAIDLNADLGEGQSCDAELLKIVSSCNIACGGHTGSAASMSETVRAARANKVAVGAHPSYPDREGFGRRSNYIGGHALQQSLIAQMRELASVATACNAAVAHVKPHGALYNDAADDLALARLIAQSLQVALPHAALVGLPNCALTAAADELGIPYWAEGFVDRAYDERNRLVARVQPHALITEPQKMALQAIKLLDRVDTLCIHGDTPGAVEAALHVRQALTDHGTSIRAIAG